MYKRYTRPCMHPTLMNTHQSSVTSTQAKSGLGSPFWSAWSLRAHQTRSLHYIFDVALGQSKLLHTHTLAHSCLLHSCCGAHPLQGPQAQVPSGGVHDIPCAHVRAHPRLLRVPTRLVWRTSEIDAPVTCLHFSIYMHNTTIMVIAL